MFVVDRAYLRDRGLSSWPSRLEVAQDREHLALPWAEGGAEGGGAAARPDQLRHDLRIERGPVTNMVRSGGGTVEAPGCMVAQKAGLNREILTASWGGLIGMVAYKAPEGAPQGAG